MSGSPARPPRCAVVSASAPDVGSLAVAAPVVVVAGRQSKRHRCHIIPITARTCCATNCTFLLVGLSSFACCYQCWSAHYSSAAQSRGPLDRLPLGAAQTLTRRSRHNGAAVVTVQSQMMYHSRNEKAYCSVVQLPRHQQASHPSRCRSTMIGQPPSMTSTPMKPNLT